jgi:hypothetical protein
MANDDDALGLNANEIEAESEEADEPAQPTDDQPLSRVPVPVQVLWVALGAFGFVDSLFGSKGAVFPWHPIASSTTLAWAVFAMVGLVVNHLDKLGLPGGMSMSFRRMARAEKAAAKRETSVKALRQVLGDYSELLQNWATSVNLFADQLENYANTDDDVAEILARFCLGRMEEARDVIAVRGDRTRLSFWWYVEDAGGLKLLFSDDIRDEATLDHVFKPGVGLLGQCYVESRIYNLEDAPESIYYEAIRQETEYHGLLLVPVTARTSERPIGVLSIDRQRREEFDQNAENVGSALADLIAYAMETALA